MLAASAAWDALAGELHTAGTSCQAVISELSTGWTGPSATVMAAAATPYATWLHATAVQAEQTAAQTKEAVAAYEAAFAMTVPPPVITANRSQLMTLLATNVLGQNTAAIATTEAHYAAMWAQDVAAMYHYAGNAATASILKPFAAPPQPTNPAGSANQAAASVGQAAATAGSQTQTAIAQLSSMPNALSSLASPAAAAAPSSATASAGLGAAVPGLAADPALTLAYLGLASSLFGSFIIDGAGTFGVDVAGSFGIDLIGVGEIGQALELPLGAGLTGWSEPASAALGEAGKINGLSVPQAWTAAAPAAAQYAGPALAAAVGDGGSAVGGFPFAEMAIAGLAGRAMAGAGRGGRAGGKSGAQPSPKLASNGPVTVIADELRELAELRDAGILTDEEFTEQKRRLLDG